MDLIRFCVLVLMMKDMERLAVSLPEMAFTGMMLATKGSTIFHFVCETSSVFLGCTVNFLKNGRSQESIRYDPKNDTCYHSNEFAKGLCIPEICLCSGCQTFVWNYTMNSKSNMVNLSFECDGNIFENPKRFKGNAVIQFIRNKFIISKPRITEYGGKQFVESSLVTTSTTTVPLKGKDKTCGACADHEHDDSLHTLVLVITVAVLIICVILILLLAVKIANCFKKKTPMSEETDEELITGRTQIEKKGELPYNIKDNLSEISEHQTKDNTVSDMIHQRPERNAQNNETNEFDSIGEGLLKRSEEQQCGSTVADINLVSPQPKSKYLSNDALSEKFKVSSDSLPDETRDDNILQNKPLSDTEDDLSPVVSSDTKLLGAQT